MLIESPPTEYVCQLTAAEQELKLKTHFNAFFSLFCEEADANSEVINGVKRHISNIPSPDLNALEGLPLDNFDQCIENQIAHFNKLEIPFVWYVDENSDSSFQTKLNEHGFKNLGIYQGVMGILDESIHEPQLPIGCSLELVTTLEAMKEFNEIVCTTFEIDGVSKDLYQTTLWKLSNKQFPSIFHWLGRKEGVAVSALTTFIDGPLVSFWNGASVPSIRKQGLNTALRKKALKHAISRDCNWGCSYLMAGGMALGICTKLGYKPQWRFNAFLFRLEP